MKLNDSVEVVSKYYQKDNNGEYVEITPENILEKINKWKIQLPVFHKYVSLDGKFETDLKPLILQASEEYAACTEKWIAVINPITRKEEKAVSASIRYFDSKTT